MATNPPPKQKSPKPRRISKAETVRLLPELLNAIASSQDSADAKIDSLLDEYPWLAQIRIPQIPARRLPRGATEGMTALVYAVVVDNIRPWVVEKLLRLGASPNALTLLNEGVPLQLALSHYGSDRRGKSWDDWAVREAVNILIRGGARLDLVDNSGIGILYSPGIPLDLAEDLLAKGARVNCWQHGTRHCLDGLMYTNSVSRQPVALMLARHADLTHPLTHGALGTAFSRSLLPVCEVLLERGANLQQVDYLGKSLAFYARGSQHMDWLLDRAPGLLDAPNWFGETPLLHYMKLVKSHVYAFDTAMALLMRGANPDALDVQGPGLCESPRQLAENLEPDRRAQFMAAAARQEALRVIADECNEPLAGLGAAPTLRRT